MSRYRLLPTPAQEVVLREHCAHARYVWNLAVEQHTHWHPGRTGAPGYLEQCRQLTQVVGIDRGVAVSAALSSGELLHVPDLTAQERQRLRRLQRKLARARRGSNRRAWVKLAIARLRARETDARSRESQARFGWTACGFASHADVNAARNIAAGHAVTARGGDGVARPVNREPQLLLQSA
jgi:transposase